MNRTVAIASILFAGITLAPLGNHVAADEQPLFGYSAESSRIERQWEEKLRAIPSPENLRNYMQRLSAHPHHVGSPYDKENAEWIAAKFKEFGLDTHIEQFDVLFPTPKERVVELVEGGPKFVAKLQEPALTQDPTSSQQAEQLPTYNAYSIDGDVTAPLVYVNYGIPEDYEQLDRMGISVKGKIVIARYYPSWRGIKPKVAAEHGAVGCLIFSDPHEDGFVQGETFPAGAFRPPDGVQRGSVADMPFYPGDPLTPGVGATKDAKRLKVEEAPTITKIPVLPISYADAQPLLVALTGRVAPEGWRGGLGITYHVGPGVAKVHLKVKSNWDIKQLYDELRAHGVAYINSDGNGRGYLRVEGSHTLEKFSNDIAHDISDPETKLSVWKRQQLREISDAKTSEQREEIRKRSDLRIPALGSGSDYTAFLQHDGVAALNIGFGGEDQGGIYHSIYDGFYWFTHFSDTDFVYGRALAQTGGTAIIRLADADLLPFEFGDFADTVQTYLKELKALSQKMQDDIRERNREIEEGVFKATDDPKRPLVPPAVETVPPHLNFAPMENALDALSRSAAEYRRALEHVNANGGAALVSASLAEVNKMLIESERKLTNAEGLPNRPWFKHQLYAPGFYTGYGVKTVPAVREAIELKNGSRPTKRSSSSHAFCRMKPR